MHKLIYWLFFAKMKMATCIPERVHSGFSKVKNPIQISKIGQMPSVINEGSGIIPTGNGLSFYTHNDGGSLPEVFEINEQGNLLATKKIPDANNTDWEDITIDNKNNLYIGDFGNNANTRKDLNIIKYSSTGSSEKIEFELADQKTFPPKKSERNFDIEAFFWASDSLYLFSKNRGQKNTNLYKIPAQKGQYKLLPSASILLKANITGASISPNKSQFALLSYGKIFIFGIENQSISFQKPLFCFKAALKQAEGITYLSENELLITNEQGEIFKIKIGK